MHIIRVERSSWLFCCVTGKSSGVHLSVFVVCICCLGDGPSIHQGRWLTNLPG